MLRRSVGCRRHVPRRPRGRVFLMLISRWFRPLVVWSRGHVAVVPHKRDPGFFERQSMSLSPMEAVYAVRKLPGRGGLGGQACPWLLPAPATRMEGPPAVPTRMRIAASSPSAMSQNHPRPGRTRKTPTACENDPCLPPRVPNRRPRDRRCALPRLWLHVRRYRAWCWQTDRIAQARACLRAGTSVVSSTMPEADSPAVYDRRTTGRPWTHGIERAAQILTAARYPLVYGLRQHQLRSAANRRGSGRLDSAPASTRRPARTTDRGAFRFKAWAK